MKILHIILLIKASMVTISAASYQGRTYRIKPRPCKDQHGEQGICMFQWECRQRKGVMLTTCFDRFLFGTCCQLSREEMDQLQLGPQHVYDNTTISADKVKPTEAAIQAPLPANLTSETLLTNPESDSTADGDYNVNSTTNNFVLSEENFSPPETLNNDVNQLNGPSHSTPDIDKLFQQFLGSVLANQSTSETFLTNPTMLEGSDVSIITTPWFTLPTWSSTNKPSSTSVTPPTAMVTLMDDVHADYVTTTSVPLIIDSASDNSDYEMEYTLEEPEANVSTLVYEPVSNDPPTTNEDVYPILLGNSTTSSVTVVENQIPNDNQQNQGTLQETSETIQHDVTDYDTEYFDDETTTTITTTTTPTTTTTTTITTTKPTTTTTTTEPPTTTTAKQYNYKKDDMDDDADTEKFFFSSWNWPTSFLIHIFTVIPSFVQRLLGINRVGSLCKASECEPQSDDQPSFLSNDTYCGVRPLMPNGRIVGGTGSKFGEWPWQVLVKEATWLGLFVKNKCGGVLVNRNYVITAAHCQPSFLASLLVVFGESDLSSSNEEFKSTQRNVKRVIVHRKFNALTFDNDLALLELDRPIEYKPHIVPICLPPDNFEFKDRIAVVSGWGRLKYGGRLPTRLQHVEIPIIPNKKCQQMFLAAGQIKSINDKFLCAGYQEGVKDSCEGDSGGPLTVQGDDGRWILVGTVSHGIKCAYPNLPGVYIRISAYKTWIQRVIGS